MKPAAIAASLVNMREEWRAIPGYEGRYEASSEGRIRSLPRATEVKNRWGGSHTCRYDGQVLMPNLDVNGYHGVEIDGRRFKISRLIALAFLGPRPAGMHVCH